MRSNYRFRHGRISAILIILLFSCGSGFLGGWMASKGSYGVLKPSAEQRQQIVLQESEVIADIANSLGESVVSVNSITTATERDFFGSNQIFQQEGAGTGFVISEDGVILTNRHVVPIGTTSVTITLSDGTEFDNVEIIGRTNSNDPLDIAFLRIKDTKGKKLKVAKLGDSSKVEVGDKVVAIGNALGQFQNSVTSGIISGYGRTVEAGDGSGANPETLQNLFQTDTAINQGNSGGPLVNIDGEVIGVNTAVAGGAENIGFAIPINDVRGLIKSVLEKGKLLRPYLGVRYITLTDSIAKELGVASPRGAYLMPRTDSSAVISGSPAEKAGLQEGDIITKVNDQEVDEKNSLIALLGKYSVGDQVFLTIMRDSKEQKVTVILEAAPSQ